MSKKASEILKDNISLIYEYNNKSPLFAKMASMEIENSNYDKAIDILEKGISLYPDYPVPYFILGKALALKGNFNLAIKNIKTGSSLIHSKKTYNYYLKEIENIKQQRSLYEGKENISIPAGKLSNKEEDFFADEDDNYHDDSAIDDSLEQIAKKISSARMPEISKDIKVDEESAAIHVDDKMIVSDTLAKIYAAQGEINEAIKVYEKLLKKDPQKTIYYTQKINALKSERNS